MKLAVHFVKLLVSIVLFMVAYLALDLLTKLLLGLNLLLILVFNRQGLFGRLEKLRRYFYRMAFAKDVVGNAMGYEFFNVTMKKPGGHEYGSPREPISYAIAKNWEHDNNTRFGRFWAGFLNWVDFGARKRGSNHLIESIESIEGRKPNML